MNSRWVWIGSVLATGVVLAWVWPRAGSTPDERRARAEGRTIVTYWDRHAGHEHTARVDLFNEFNAIQDEIFVRAVAIGYNASMEKILTSTAGGAPPDIMGLDCTMLYQLAPQGVFQPLDDLVASTPALQQEKLFPHCWDQVAFDGHVWAVPTTTDTYCLLWNKALFREAGLDPEHPPQTVEELKEYAARLTVRNAAGRVERAGFVPWLPWDMSVMWGALFGSDWYNESTGYFDFKDDQAALASMVFQRDFAWGDTPDTRNPFGLDQDSIAAFSEGARSYMSANNLFYAGKVAMITEGEWQVSFIAKYAPGLEWGVAALPQAEGVPARSYSPSSVVDAVPATAHEPEAARKFLAWFYSPRTDGRPSPASDYNRAIDNIPPLREDAAGEAFMSNPKFRAFVEQLLDRPTFSFPVTPVTQRFVEELERQRERVILRLATPEQALAGLEHALNRELDRLRALEARSAA